MLNYSYTAKNAKTGQKVKSTVQADNEQSAAKAIKEQGLSPLSITAEGSGGIPKIKFFGRIKTKDKVLFSRQMSTLINAGLPLVQSLRSVGMQTVNKQFKQVINDVISDVEGGTAFNAALAKHPAVFNRVYVSLVAASET